MTIKSEWSSVACRRISRYARPSTTAVSTVQYVSVDSGINACSLWRASASAASRTRERSGAGISGVSLKTGENSTTCSSVRVASASWAILSANTIASRALSEKSTGQRIRRNWIGDPASTSGARGGTTKVGQGAFRITFSVTEPRKSR